MRDQLVNETIDGRILRLLGLEDVFDLDYDTYLVLLREAQIKGKNKIPAEEQAILANERKRIRGKSGRFKPKSKTVKAEKFTTIKTVGSRLLPAAKQKATGMPLVKSLESVGKIVESISNNLSEQSKNDKKVAEEDRKEEENKRRKEKEDKLEFGVKKVVASAKKLFSPVKSLFDTLFNYLFYTFLGGTFTRALDWLANPANKEKVNAIGKFVKDFWPALLGSAVLFLTPLGKFIRDVLGLIGGLALRFPLVAAAAGFGVLGYMGYKEKEKVKEKYVAEQSKKTGKKPEEIKEEFKKIEERNEFFRSFSAPAGLTSGGYIDSSTGLRISGAGPDTQLTALQPGEVVMNRAAVNALGANNLLALNAKYGGSKANKPKFAGNIQFAQGGGMVGMLHNVRKFLTQGTGRVMAPTESNIGYQRKFLGMNIGNVKNLPLDKTYRQQDVERYNAMRASAGQRDRLVKDPFFGRHFSYTDPMMRSGSTSTPPTSTPTKTGRFTKRNLTGLMQGYLGTEKGGRVQQMEEIMGTKFGTMTQKQFYDQLKKEYGESTVGEQRRLLLGPQSRALPIPTPSKGRSSIINLPPIMQTASSAGVPARSGETQIPSFSAVAPDNRRSDQAAIYGLVG
jgi:hypothetical protein